MNNYLIGLITGVLLTAGSMMLMGSAHRVYNPWSTLSEKGSDYLRSETPEKILYLSEDIHKRIKDLNSDITEIGTWVYEIRVNQNSLTGTK